MSTYKNITLCTVLVFSANASSVGAGDSCIADDKMCRCFKPGAKSIVQWPSLLTFNSCCLTDCVVPAIPDPCLIANNCSYDAVKGIFETCGSPEWPATAPEYDGVPFKAPQACPFFPNTATGIVNWRDPTTGLKGRSTCLQCAAGQLPTSPADGAAYSYDDAKDAFETCGSGDWPATLPAAIDGIAVLPQSSVACAVLGDGALDAATLADWRIVLTDPATLNCGLCVLGRIQAGEQPYDDLNGVVESLTSCGWPDAARTATLAQADLAENLKEEGFTPPGCANFDIGEGPDYSPGIAAWPAVGNNDPAQKDTGYYTPDCQACLDAYANGTAKDAPKKYNDGAGTCVPGQLVGAGDNNCTYAETAAAFKHCGAGDSDWNPNPDDFAPWPATDPVANDGAQLL